MNNLIGIYFRNNKTMGVFGLNRYFTNRGYINLVFKTEMVKNGYSIAVYGDKARNTGYKALELNNLISDLGISISKLAVKLNIKKSTLFYYTEGRAINVAKYDELIYNIKKLYSKVVEPALYVGSDVAHSLLPIGYKGDQNGKNI